MCSAMTDDHSDLSWFLALKVEPNANKIPLTSQAGLFVKLLCLKNKGNTISFHSKSVLLPSTRPAFPWLFKIEEKAFPTC